MDRLPPDLTVLIGREPELHDAVLLLSSTRILTVTGAGGVGKTRFALAVARAAAGAFRDGAVFVPLATVRDGAQVLPAVAAALELRVDDERRAIEALEVAIGGRQLLLVLDNLEQIEDVATQVWALVTTCPAVSVVATSRTTLRLTGEQELPLAPLTLPAGDTRAVDAVGRAPAVALFVERARACRPDFQLTMANASAVAAICRQLDGLPLALELAAAWLRVLDPAALLARLDHQLPLLTGGPVDLPDRQQTMRAAIAWSVRLLDAEARRLFAGLASFPGGWTLAGAEAIAEDPDTALPLLALLVDHHLVEVSEEPDGTARYRMLAPIREYAEELLVASEDVAVVRQRQAEHLLALAEQTASRSGEADYDAWLDRLERERDNLRVALGHATSPVDLRLATALYGFWYLRGSVREGVMWHARVLERAPDGPVALRVRALYQAGELTRVSGDYPGARALADRALDAALDSGDAEGVALARFLQGNIATSAGDLAEAVELLQDALLRAQALGDTNRVAFALNNLGQVWRRRGDLDHATRLFHDAYETWRRAGDEWGSAIALGGLGDTARGRGDPATASHFYRHALRLFVKLEDRWSIADTLSDLGAAQVALGAHERGGFLLVAGDTLRETLGVVPSPAERSRLDQARAEARSAVRATRWDRLVARASSATPDEVVREALESVSASSVTPERLPFAGLSPREQEVLLLLTTGRSNHQIASELRISPHTAAAHVTSILNKLGVESRTEAATLALRCSATRPDHPAGDALARVMDTIDGAALHETNASNHDAG